MIRAEGSPKYARASTLSGAILNYILAQIEMEELCSAVQIVMNNTLGHHGELSPYRRDSAIACVGIISKDSANECHC